jgi:hypothetical protein
MNKRFARINKKITSFFLGYLFLVLLFPLAHCHAAGGLTGNGFCGTGPGSEHFRVSLPGNPCCEIHEQGRHAPDRHHLYFLLQDQTATVRSTQLDYSSAAEPVFSAAKQSFHLFEQSAERVLANESAFSPQLFLTTHSGLSPPSLL